MVKLSLEQQIAVYERAQALLARPGGYVRFKLYCYTGRFHWLGLRPNSIASRWATGFCARGAISRALHNLDLDDWEPNGQNELTLSAKVGGMLQLQPVRGYQYPLVWALAVFNNSTDQQTVVAGFGIVIEKLKAKLATSA